MTESHKMPARSKSKPVDPASANAPAQTAFSHERRGGGGLVIRHEESDDWILRAEGWIKLWKHSVRGDKDPFPWFLLQAISALETSRSVWRNHRPGAAMRPEWHHRWRQIQRRIFVIAQLIARPDYLDIRGKWAHLHLDPSDKATQKKAKQIASRYFLEDQINWHEMMRNHQAPGGQSRSFPIDDVADAIGVEAGTLRNRLSEAGVAPKRGKPNSKRTKKGDASGRDLPNAWLKKN